MIKMIIPLEVPRPGVTTVTVTVRRVPPARRARHGPPPRPGHPCVQGAALAVAAAAAPAAGPGARAWPIMSRVES